ncbi:MAG TPA: CRISPR-associated DxTHG motif protein, partial [Ignavibacteria bacterium]|nr:CRISPR-associated DxTHG motif protein [Ignavibacteria bacterium]
DLTHGFRHIPILAIIDLVIQNFKKTNKIEKILFAKEIIKHTKKSQGEYEIVDLKGYLDIANISFVLSSFENNYTISNHIKTADKDFQELINMLSRFSEHIMANSLINLFKGQNSLVEKILNAIESIKKHEKISPLLTKLEAFQEHLKLFVDLKEKREDIQLFELAKLVNKKGYYLNAITLLDEAIGWYCAHSLCQYSIDFKEIFKKQIDNYSYKITSNAKNIIKFTFDSREYHNELGVKDSSEIQETLKNIKDCEKFSRNLIVEVANNRNDLAHANNQKKLNDVKNMLEKLFGRFQTYCIDKDILRKKESSIDDLKAFFA